MKVWVLRWIDYEESGIVGVFTTREAAMEAAPPEAVWREGDYATGGRYDHDVAEYEVWE